MKRLRTASVFILAPDFWILNSVLIHPSSLIPHPFVSWQKRGRASKTPQRRRIALVRLLQLCGAYGLLVLLLGRELASCAPGLL
jgi:hypothetical protein